MLNKITNKIEGAISPAVIPELCNSDVIALEYISGKTFHELWLDRSYPEERVLKDIVCLYDWIRVFHRSTVGHSIQLPYSYGDFGPKNLISLDNDGVAFIDPPLKFRRRDVHFDFGTLVFEIDRSLIQASRLNLVWKNRKFAEIWVGSTSTTYSYNLYLKGVQRHVFDVVLRYGTFFKKPSPIIEFFRGLFWVPCIIFYHVVLIAYGVMLRWNMR